MNIDYAFAFNHFVKKLYPNAGNFEEFNAQPNKDNRIQYSLNLTSESFLNPEYNIENCYKNLKINMKYNNINILFILVKDHEHVSHIELLTDVTITIDPINDLSFRYQSDKIHEFITILRRCNPQNILNVCEKDSVVTIYNKESLNFYCKQHLDVKNIKVQKRKVDIRKYKFKLTQEEIDKLMLKYLNKAVNTSANPKKFFNITFRKINNKNYIDQLKYFHGNMIFNDEVHKIIAETVRKIFNSAFKNTCEYERQWFFKVVKANLCVYFLTYLKSMSYDVVFTYSIKTTPRYIKTSRYHLKGKGSSILDLYIIED
ncbi:42256_t:CDS:1 [Gigaspora margarita]|uniref:42256_t:CDS:1 n=1 Tax=Gigaspora margarita TaxID=4874 RepID=A0ABN7V2H5_GIGMA|nr:42256_t:CDS:1 [Gigaspora margarita]